MIEWRWGNQGQGRSQRLTPEVSQSDLGTVKEGKEEHVFKDGTRYSIWAPSAALVR